MELISAGEERCFLFLRDSVKVNTTPHFQYLSSAYALNSIFIGNLPEPRSVNYPSFQICTQTKSSYWFDECSMPVIFRKRDRGQYGLSLLLVAKEIGIKPSQLPLAKDVDSAQDVVAVTTLHRKNREIGAKSQLTGFLFHVKCVYKCHLFTFSVGNALSFHVRIN